MVDTNQTLQDEPVMLSKRQKLTTDKQVITKKTTPNNKKFPLLLKTAHKLVLMSGLKIRTKNLTERKANKKLPVVSSKPPKKNN